MKIMNTIQLLFWFLFGRVSKFSKIWGESCSYLPVCALSRSLVHTHVEFSYSWKGIHSFGKLNDYQVNYALGALYYLCNASNKEKFMKPEVVDVIKRYAVAESSSFSNLAKAILDKHLSEWNRKLLSLTANQVKFCCTDRFGRLPFLSYSCIILLIWVLICMDTGCRVINDFPVMILALADRYRLKIILQHLSFV